MHVYKPPPVGGLDRVPVFTAGTGTTRATLFELDGVTPMPGNVLVADTGGNLPSFQCAASPVFVGASGSRTTWTPNESGDPTTNAASVVPAPVTANAGSTAVTLDGATAVWGKAHGKAGLPNWFSKLTSDPTNATMALVGDSTSYDTLMPSIYSQLRSVHAQVNGALAGVQSANIVQGGSNGMTLTAWLGGGTGTGLSLAQTISGAYNLVILSWGINDIRTGSRTQAQITADLVTAVNAIRAGSPNTDIVLRVPNSFLTDDVGAHGYVTPNSSAQAYSTALRNAYLSLVDRWPNVVVWDAQTRVFGTTSLTQAQAGSGMMSDQLHPGGAGQIAIADMLVYDVIGLPVGNQEYVAPVAKITDPKGPGVAYADSRVGISQTAYTLDRTVLYDPNKYRLVHTGAITNIAAGFVRISTPTGSTGGGRVAQANDICEFPDGVVFKITGGPTEFNDGNPIPGVQISQTLPANTAVAGQWVRIWREIGSDPLLGYRRESKSYPFIKVGRIASAPSSGNFIVDRDDANAPTTGTWPITQADSMVIDGYGSNPVALTGKTLGLNGNNIWPQGFTGIDFTPYVGRLVVFYGSHQPDTTTEKKVAVAVAAGTVAATSTADVAVTFTGAIFAQTSMSSTGVIAQPRGTMAAGVTWTAFVSAADTVTIRFCNPTASGVVVGTVNFDLWLIR